MLRQAVVRGAQCGCAIATKAPLSLSHRSFSIVPWSPFTSNPFRNLERQIREMEDYFDRAFPASRGWATDFFPMREREHPTLTEFYRIKNPIIEEDGVKKFMLEFDVRRFKPEEVSVTTNAKDNTLTIEAKHKDENSKYEFSRKMTLPAGVVPKELTCRFKTDGVLEVKAPYNPPPEAEPIKDTDIQVKHE
ncbi:Major egg antigen [Toxocara canis]|uniref:Major egg antigen n=1 Tax=Toxocara canis TaxID=6265 RepID=A0A0B2VG31_TOXCA|nr:Major egg antigen [Toxocara canis]